MVARCIATMPLVRNPSSKMALPPTLMPPAAKAWRSRLKNAPPLHSRLSPIAAPRRLISPNARVEPQAAPDVGVLGVQRRSFAMQQAGRAAVHVVADHRAGDVDGAQH